MSKILVVVDMQNDFIDGSLGSKEAEAIVDRVVEKIEKLDGVVEVGLVGCCSDALIHREFVEHPVEGIGIIHRRCFNSE